MLTHFKKIWAYSFHHLKFGGENVITVKSRAETRVTIQEIRNFAFDY